MANKDEIVRGASGRPLGRAGIIDYDKLIKLKFEKGLENKDIAEHFGVTTQAIGQALRRLQLQGLGDLYARGQELAETTITVQSLIAGLMVDAADILKDIKQAIKREDENSVWNKMSIDKRKLQLSTMSEIRSQIDMYQKISDKLYSMEANEEFQKIVIDTIREESPEVAEKIRERLSKHQPLREFIGAAGRK